MQLWNMMLHATMSERGTGNRGEVCEFLMGHLMIELEMGIHSTCVLWAFSFGMMSSVRVFELLFSSQV